MNNGFEPQQGYTPPAEVKRRYTPEEAGHSNNGKPVSRRRRRRRRPPNPGVVLIAIVFAAVVGVCLYFIISGRGRTHATPEDSGKDSAAVIATDGSDSAPFDDGRDYYTVTLPKEQIYSGDLILVNSVNEYKFPKDAESQITDISSLKNEYYLLSAYSTKLAGKVVERFNNLCTDYFNETGFRYMQVNSAYRSKQDQIDIYADYTESYGEDYAKSYVANPGYSEHHTGLAMDLNVNRNGTIDYVESCEDCRWFRDNCKYYGFILRYPKDKVYMTGISYESWHYRYVGEPHAEIITDMNLCLEEYELYIKDFTYDTTRLVYGADGTVSKVPAKEGSNIDGVQIYYAAAEGDETEVKIPKGYVYNVSGNNSDGFIITAEKEQ